MASVYDLKPGFQKLLRPTTRFLAGNGITANFITFTAMLLSMMLGAAIYGFPDNKLTLFAIPAWLFFRMALNAIDGMLAREHDMKTPLGAILNELGDVISDTAIYLPMGMIPGMNAALVVIIVILSLISEMAGIVPVQIGASRHYEGPMGKSDRAFVLGLIALLLGFDVLSQEMAAAICWVVAGLLVVTIVNRSVKGLREIKKNGQ